MSLSLVVLFIGGGIGSILCASLILIRTFLMIVTIEGGSMEPTFVHGDRVLVLRSRLLPRIRKGQIVVIWQSHSMRKDARSPVLPYIKRVTAIAGETYVSCIVPLWRGEQVRENEKAPGTFLWSIPQDHIFVCGDNSEQSLDSRT